MILLRGGIDLWLVLSPGGVAMRNPNFATLLSEHLKNHGMLLMILLTDTLLVFAIYGSITLGEAFKTRLRNELKCTQLDSSTVNDFSDSDALKRSRRRQRPRKRRLR